MYRNLDFEEWMKLVDAQIARFLGWDDGLPNDITAPYAEYYQRGMSAMEAALSAIDVGEDMDLHDI